jgi:predicted porin
MKKTLIAMAAVAVAGVASAQATITGKLGVGIYESSKIAKYIGTSDSGITVSASEDLGGGMTASASFSTTGMGAHGAGINADGTSLSLAGGFGSVVWSIGNSDNDRLGAGAGLLLSGNTAFAASGADTGGTASAANLQYNLPSLVDGLSIGVRLANGSTANQVQLTNEDPQVRVAYASGAFGLTYNTTGGTAAANDMGVTYDAGIAKFAYAADITVPSAGTSGKRTEWSVSIPLGSLTLAASMGNRAASKDGNQKKASATEFNASYALSKRTSINAAYASTVNTSNVSGKANTIKLVHTF